MSGKVYEQAFRSIRRQSVLNTVVEIFVEDVRKRCGKADELFVVGAGLTLVFAEQVWNVVHTSYSMYFFI